MTQHTDGTDGHHGPLTAPDEIERLALDALRQRKKLDELAARVLQLQAALDSRIVLERANGILAERYDLPIDEAFALLREAARNSRRRIRDVATDIVEAPREFSPAEIVDALRRLAP